MARAKTKAAANRDKDIEECEAALGALAEACRIRPIYLDGPGTEPDTTLQDHFGYPAPVTYDVAMQRILRVDRAAFALAKTARAAGHPVGALEHLRTILDPLLRNPMRQAGHAIDVSNLGLKQLEPELDIAVCEVWAIEQRRAAERSAGIEIVGRDDGEKPERVALDEVNDPDCVMLRGILSSGPKMLEALAGDARCYLGRRQVSKLLRLMSAVGLVGQTRNRGPWQFLSDTPTK